MLHLKQVLNEPSWGMMKKSLENPPRDLPSTFQGYLDRLGDREKSSWAPLAWKTLVWLTFTREPLDLERLQKALAIQRHSTRPDSTFDPDMSCMLERCLGLVVVDKHAHTVRLVHFSLQEFLKTYILTEYRSGLEELALDCYTYLSYDDFSKSPCTSDGDIVARLDEYPLLEYFARHWRYHTLACSDSLDVQTAAIDLMSSDPHRANLRQMSRFVAGYRWQYYDAEEVASTHALHMLASLGLVEVFRKALESHKDKINLPTRLVQSTPIILAAAAGHVEITRYLCERGADPYIPNRYGNALHCAAEANVPSVITLLLDVGMDKDTRTAHGATPLACTTDNDAADAAAVLLSRGADAVNIYPEQHTNLLLAAVQDRCPRLVALILSRRCVDIETEGGLYNLTALRTATLLLHHAEIISSLADATSDVATAEFHKQVARTLQKVPVALHEELSNRLEEIFLREGWQGVEGRIMPMLEEAEGT